MSLKHWDIQIDEPHNLQSILHILRSCTKVKRIKVPFMHVEYMYLDLSTAAH